MWSGTCGSKNKAAVRAAEEQTTMKLPNGEGSITFEGVKSWASFKVSHQPGNGLALTGAVAALLGLAGSLFIQRRRVWVRAEKGADGVTVVEMAGLGRSESARLPEELAGLAGALFPDAPPAPDAEPGTGPGTESGAPSEPDAGPAPDTEDPAEPTDSDGPADPSEGARA